MLKLDKTKAEICENNQIRVKTKSRLSSMRNFRFRKLYHGTV